MSLLLTLFTYGACLVLFGLLTDRLAKRKVNKHFPKSTRQKKGKKGKGDSFDDRDDGGVELDNDPVLDLPPGVILPREPELAEA